MFIYFDKGATPFTWFLYLNAYLLKVEASNRPRPVPYHSLFTTNIDTRISFCAERE